ncbi:copper oxidase [Mycolicibacterium aromaticivorans JS19b1 = JCM 16368]|uniref:Multicopper oxidase CueO n=1 Tax=Mycolicibacterium aromaticivorans JS19b1 = JCM 16368 TaxID=1440774 RepID=A0A064CFT1_9MYCO|nr:MULTISPECIES: multicopper oxidase domain-containing protein [Mycolicibacterium]KDE99459.1 copper oxidase [Mycolicibacterium aromaticivorans JS19b1 = JCM 16368]MCV7153997.1 multicopper oxidase domain-containing protein [Mycolicibacterium pyrenivorans]
MPGIDRRTFLVGIGATGLLVAACGTGESPPASTTPTSRIPARPFDRRLPIPQLAPSTVEGGARHFSLRAAPGQTEIVAGTRTPTWGYNGSMLGPTLRARRGETVAVTVDNQLPETTTSHWHGMHLPARFDGGPHQPIEPGAQWRPTWTIDQPAASLWYHPHPHGATLRHVYRGLTGMFLIDDDQEPQGLPNTYGVDDIPVIIADYKFTPDGALDESDPDDIGLLGDTIATNGLAGAYFDASTRQLRMRLLNASVGRVYNLGFSDDRPFAMIASDGGLLEKPVSLTRIQLSPAERAEIVVQLNPGEPILLHAFPIDKWPDETFRERFGYTDSFDVLELRPDPQLRDAAPLPAVLATLPAAAVPADATRREFRLQRGTDANGKNNFKINDQLMDMNRIDFDVPEGSTEIWEVVGRDRVWPHNFHVHNAQFRVLDIAGQAPPPELAGWKDTVFIYPQTTVRVAVRFNGYGDSVNPFMYHCHLLFHEDTGMMGQFRVVAPGQPPPSVPGHSMPHG